VTKHEIRKEILDRRLGLSDSETTVKSETICGRLISDSAFVGASTVGLYWPFRNEVRTESIFRAARTGGKRVGFPLVRAGDRMIAYIAVDDPAEMSRGTYGIMEPRYVPDRVIRPEEFDFIVIPGVAFDERGYRIGYGAGYFDRLLAGDAVGATRAAPAFDIQIIDRVPHADHDEKVDIIFTESRVITCS
jgi:5-formyltetrahydrofolate cyclo-ligase